MNNKSAEILPKPKFKKSTFLLNAIAQVHFGAERRDLPGWAKNARAQFLDSFNSLAKKSEFYRCGYKQAMWDMMVEELAKESEWWAAQRKEAAKLYKIDGELPYDLTKSTDREKLDYYTGKVAARERFCDGGLSPRQKCVFFMSTNHKCFEGLGQKEAHEIFVELNFITNSTDESQTRQWLSEIGFRSGRRGRKPKR